MYDVCLDALPYLIGTSALVIAIVRCWEFFTGLVVD